MCLRDLDPGVRDQAAASLIARLGVDVDARYGKWQAIHNDCTADYLAAYPSPTTADPALSELLHMEAQWNDESLQQPTYDPTLPLGWACMVTGAVVSNEILYSTRESQLVQLAKHAPLTALALLAESHRTQFWNRDWDSLGGFIMAHHEGKPSGMLLARMRGMLASGEVQDRAAAAMAWSELIAASRTIHTHELQAMGAVCGKHFDPAVRCNSLPGRLLRAGLPDAKFSVFEDALRDLDSEVRAFALALLCGAWEGPWASSGPSWSPPRQSTPGRLWPPRVFYRIWTLNAVEEEGCWGLASIGMRDESCVVRYQAAVLIAKLCKLTIKKTLHLAFKGVLRGACVRDPDEGVRDVACWLCSWLKIS